MKLGDRGQQIERRTIDAQHMKVGREHIGHKALCQHSRRRVETERHAAVTKVENHPAFAGQPDLFPDFAIGAQQRVGKGLEAMGQDIARTQPHHHLPA